MKMLINYIVASIVLIFAIFIGVANSPPDSRLSSIENAAVRGLKTGSPMKSGSESVGDKYLARIPSIICTGAPSDSYFSAWVDVRAADDAEDISVRKRRLTKAVAKLRGLSDKDAEWKPHLVERKYDEAKTKLLVLLKTEQSVAAESDRAGG